jgi:hypothetical protein
MGEPPSGCLEDIMHHTHGHVPRVWLSPKQLYECIPDLKP